MSTVSALLVLGQGAFLSGSWWLARALRREDGRLQSWVVWAALAVAVVGATPELASALSGNLAFDSLGQGIGLISVFSLAVSQAGLSAVAGGRALRSAQERHRLEQLAIAQLAHGDAAFAGGRWEEARASYQEQVTLAQGAGEEAAIRQGLARVAWLDYLTSRFEEARASIAWAAGGGDLDPAAGSEVVLLAGCLAMAGGRLDVARPAIEDAIRMSEAAADVSQTNLARVVLGCEHYLEGWGESGRQYVESHVQQRLDGFDQQLAGTLLVALSLAARHRGRPGDAVALAELALPLVAGNEIMAPLAGHAAQPEGSPWLERPARAHLRLLLPVADGAPAATAAR